MKDRPPRTRRATAEDVAVGQKVRALRLHGGLSQGALAAQIGVTLQQVQKYESGANRISAGRLVRVAAALGAPVTAFYRAAGRPQREQGFAYLRTKGAMRLARAYAAIAQRGLKAALVALAEAAANARRG